MRQRSNAYGQESQAGSYEQDCAVLGDIVAAGPDDLDSALERYERQRKPDAHALGTMDHQVCPAPTFICYTLRCRPPLSTACIVGHSKPLMWMHLRQSQVVAELDTPAARRR